MATLRVNSGVYSDPDLDGLTVATVRSRFRGVHNISPDAPAFVNGCAVSNEDNLTLGSTDELLFAKPSGTKGQ